MFMALELDRSNLAQALTDNFLGDLKMNTNGEFHRMSFLLLCVHCVIHRESISTITGVDNYIRLQSREHGLQVGVFVRRVALAARLQMGWS